MMISEFIERTGFEPTASEYAKIEDAYYDFNGNKDEFCKAFVKNGDEKKFSKARAEEIAQLKSQLVEMEKQHKSEMEACEKQIAELNADLNRELEWKPCDGSGTNMAQERYEHLANCGKVMTDEEAAAFIADECGFALEKIHILHEVNTYEVNKHRRLRVAGTFNRAPVYESTDWNYVRFDCACFMYEFVNGQLCFYCC